MGYVRLYEIYFDKNVIYDFNHNIKIFSGKKAYKFVVNNETTFIQFLKQYLKI